MATVYRTGSSRVLAASIGAIAGIGLIALAVDDGLAGVLRYGWWIGLAATLAWATFWNPRIEVDDSGVTLVNVFRTITLPWPSISGIDTRWALTLRTAYGSYGAWAAPAPGRHGTRDTTEQDVKHLPASTFGVGDSVRPGDTVNSPSGRAALAVRQRWEALREAGYLDNPRLEFDKPPVRWHVGLIAVILALIAIGITGLVV